MLSDAILKGVFDSMAAEIKAMVALYGRAVTDSGTISIGANSQRTKMVAEFDTDNDAARDLAGIMDEYITNSTFTAYVAQMLVPMLRKIEEHVKDAGYTDINNFLQTAGGSHAGFKVHPYLKEIWPSLLASSVWPLSIDTTTGTPDSGNEAAEFFTYDSDGAAGVGVGYAVGTALTASQYGDALIQGWVPTGKAVTTGATITVNGLDQNGSSVSIAFTTTAVTGPNKMAIAGTTRFSSVTSIVETGTTLANGDWFTILPKDDRAPTLVVP